jgi:hypothetical protein
MNADDIRFLSYYLIPKDWIIHLIDRRTNEKQLEVRKYLKKIFLILFYLANSTNY